MDTLTIVKNREKELADLYKRMDEDAARVDWTKRYRMMRLDDPTKPIDNVVNVTMNFAATYASDLASLISQATIQTVIDGRKNKRKLSDDEAAVIEDFLNTLFDLIDDSLINRGFPSLIVWLANHIVYRGWIGGRYLSWVDKNGLYVPDFAAWDCRYAAHEFGATGLKWASYRTWRLPGDIKDEYPDAALSVTNDEKEIEVVTFLDDEKQEVWAESTLVDTLRHAMGHVPAVIQPAPAGFMFRDKGYVQHEGESAFYLDRLLFDELNRSVSIEQTLAQKAVHPAYVQEKQDPNAPADPYADKVGANTAYNPGESPKLLPIGDFNMAAQLGRRDISEGLQQGGKNIDVGNIDQLFSAVAIAAIEELRRKVLIPRFQAISAFRTKLAGLMIKQRQLLDRQVTKSELGRKGFVAKDLEGDYSVKFRFMSKSKEMEIANIAIANAAKAIGIPDEVWVRDILLADNPEEMLRLMNAQKAEAVEPWIMLVRLGHQAIDAAEKLSEDAKDAKLLEARGLFEKAVMLINPPMPEAAPPATPSPQEPKGNANLLLPLLGAGARGAGGGNGAGVEVGAK